TETKGRLTIAFVTGQFEKGPLDIRVVVTAEGKVAGLQFVPSRPAVEYQSPAYVRKDKTREREVIVGKGTPWELPGTLTTPAGGARREAGRGGLDGRGDPAVGGFDRRAGDLPREAGRRAGGGGDGAAGEAARAGGEGEGPEAVPGDAGQGVTAGGAGGILAEL